jgi:peptide subunit release factor RF-3
MKSDLQELFNLVEDAYRAGIIGITDTGELQLTLDLFSHHLTIHIHKMPHIHHEKCNTWFPVDAMTAQDCPYCHKEIPNSQTHAPQASYPCLIDP